VARSQRVAGKEEETKKRGKIEIGTEGDIVSMQE
jgi:hypothetical protein